MKSPVLMIAFCRYQTTKKVFDAVRKAQPNRFYIALDAPRNTNEQIKCDEVKSIFDNIDWECNVNLLIQDKNQGCSMGPYKAISWFFEKESEGIILEDDIIPNEDFFSFCDDMLDKYRDDDRIQQICGWNYFYDGCSIDYKYSYYYCFYRMVFSLF